MPTTKTITVYKYDELSETAKEQALEHFADINVNYDWWYDDGLLELTESELKSRHIKLSDKWYEISPHANIKGEYPAYTGLFHWDRLFFDLDRNNYIQFDNLRVEDDNIFRLFLRIPKALWANVEYCFEANGRYADTELILDARDQPFTAKQEEIIGRAKDIMNDKIQAALIQLRRQYEYNTSREGIEETIRINEYEFDENGNLT